MNRYIIQSVCLRRCKNKCNLAHTDCKGGVPPDDFFHCHTSSTTLSDTKVTFIKFETSEVETFGTGKAYTRVEKHGVELSLDDFFISFRQEFDKYAHHILAAWFLRSTKLALFSPFEERRSVLTVISDFGEAFLVIGKHETAEQFFKRKEINLHGSVCTILKPVETEDNEIKLEEVNISVIISSDIKYEIIAIFS